MVAADKTLYEQLVEITAQLLGPASERFINRQIRSHLQIIPQQISAEDLKRLEDWLRLGMNVLTDDAETVQEYIEEVQKLAQEYQV